MGGEPTFVSADDMTSAQWTVAADGPEKRELANRLAGSAGRIATPRVGWSSAARASGIPVSRCLAGRSASSGEATASSYGVTRHCSPIR